MMTMVSMLDHIGHLRASRWRSAGRIALTLLALVAAAQAACAEDAFSFAATPGKLPKTVVPTFYAIELKPDFEQLTIAGSETVDVQVAAPTAEITLNAVNMTIASATAEHGQRATVAYDRAAQAATLTFPQPLTQGSHKLDVRFAAHINKFGRGLFVVDYPTADGRKRMLSSHLEPSDARRIFPSWDEPAFKASFELSVIIPQALSAVSNMPVAREEPAGGGLKRVVFQRTPRMSTYLFVLAIGDLERLAGDADGVSVGVVTTRGKSVQGRYALEEAIKLLKYYNEYFDTKYPLPKLDLIAVPGGFGGAMENWGGITFFESRLLFDPATSPPNARRSIVSILAHEMAHQWFGNLVTTAWWDDIWLNEGFASWMQSKAADHLHPDWHVWLNAGGAKQGAMAADARRSAHPIQQPVANETEAMAAFDVITYSKGQALIRMLESYLGEDKFRAGIRVYMKEHAYSNATTTDLWQALQTASGEPVTKVAAAFTQLAGVPLIVAEAKCVNGQQHIALRQERYTIRDPDAKPQHWDVPVTYGPIDGSRPPQSFVFDKPFELTTGPCGETVKLNLGDVGYYRVRYDAATLAALARALPTMAPADRVNLLADAWALVESGQGVPANFFELINRLGAENNRAVWEVVVRTFYRIDHLEQGRPGRAAFRAYARSRLRPLFDRLGWDAQAGEPPERSMLRPRLIRLLGEFDDAAILAEARRRFAGFLETPASLSTDLRDPVIHLVGRNADRATYETLLGLARKATDTNERVRYYSAVASARDTALAKQTLAITLTDELTNSLIGTLISRVASQGEHRELALQFVKDNFEALAAKQSPSFRNRFVASLMSNFSDREHAAALDRYASAQATSGARIMAARARERILTDAEFIERQLPAIDAWIAGQGTRP
jgi:aminopeptidase N